MKKIRNHFYQILNAIIIAGIIIFLTGLYYCVVKAGIPYQDPPLELQIEYEVNAEIGDILMTNGFKITIYGGIIRFIFGLISKKYQRK